MAAKADRELLTVAGREISISNPTRFSFPRRATPSSISSATTLPLPTARCGALVAGRRCSSVIRTASTASTSIRSAHHNRDPRGSRLSRSVFHPVARLKRLFPRDAASLAWMANLACLELHPHPVRADDLDHPDELRVDLDPVPGVPWSQVRDVARVVETTLGDFGLVGWPKTSGSRGIHVYVRIERRWTFGEVRRAALAFAREVERRAPTLATSKWWKEERHGVFLDYNQNAKDRTIASAYSVRPKPDARVSAPLAWHEVGDCNPEDFTLATMPDRFARIGDRHAEIDKHPCSLEPLLELSARHEKDGLGDAPWPPQYKKQAGEPARVQPSRKRTSKYPLIEIGRAIKKEDALAGVERWRARHPRAAAHLAAGGRARRRDARTVCHLDARPRQSSARAG